MRDQYVLGFLFEDDLSSVALIRKEKPAWQAKCLNGIGGKMEPDESEAAAMSREFAEEAGVTIPEDRWLQFCEMRGKGWVVYCFCCRDNGFLLRVRTMTDEQVRVINSRTFNKEPIIANLEWLVPLAKEHFTAPIESCVDYVSREGNNR